MLRILIRFLVLAAIGVAVKKVLDSRSQSSGSSGSAQWPPIKTAASKAS